MSDDIERSVASDGSVEPVAWAVRCVDDFGDIIETVCTDPIKVGDWRQARADVFPLYRSPTLTDAEREVLLGLACHCDTRSGGEWHRFSAVVRGLLERLK